MRWIDGWEVEVLDVRPSLAGRVVKIRVSPRLRGGGVPFTPDALYEVYEYRGDRLRYRGGWGRNPTWGMGDRG